jgi:hypothetical protein
MKLQKRVSVCVLHRTFALFAFSEYLYTTKLHDKTCAVLLQNKAKCRTYLYVTHRFNAVCLALKHIDV